MPPYPPTKDYDAKDSDIMDPDTKDSVYTLENAKLFIFFISRIFRM